MFEMSSSILKEPVPPLPASVPAGLRAIVERCLAKRPGERYQNAAEVRAGLERVQTSAARAPGGSQRTGRWAAAMKRLANQFDLLISSPFDLRALERSYGSETNSITL